MTDTLRQLRALAQHVQNEAAEELATLFQAWEAERIAEADERAATPDEIEKARNLYQTDDVQIYPEAVASRADEGYWVEAWVWIEDGS